MDDLYCPACRLVLFRRGSGQISPRHCPRCIVRDRHHGGLIPREQAPPADRSSGAADRVAAASAA